MHILRISRIAIVMYLTLKLIDGVVQIDDDYLLAIICSATVSLVFEFFINRRKNGNNNQN